MNANKSITLEELLATCLDGEDQDAPSNILKTPDCPPLREFEAHAKGIRFLSAEAMRHVNRCPEYCQSILDGFRRQCSDYRVAFSHATVQPLAALGSGGGPHTYGALVESVKGEVLGSATIVINDGPFLTEDHSLVFRLSVTPPFQPEMLPLRVSMADCTDRANTATHIFTFDLPTQAGEVIKIRIPGDLLEDSRWKDIDATAHLPLSFVVSPLGRCDLIS